MTHQEKASGWRSYDAIDCKTARKSLRWYKKKAHKALRQELKKECEE
jgi:hypothetical protein